MNIGDLKHAMENLPNDKPIRVMGRHGEVDIKGYAYILGSPPGHEFLVVYLDEGVPK